MAQLRLRASAYRDVASAAMFVESEVSTAGQKTERRFTDGYITFHRLMEIASEWDRDGLTTIGEFLDAAECELAGAPRCAAVAAVTSLVGRDALAMAREEAEL